jgi:putative membrane protein
MWHMYDGHHYWGMHFFWWIFWVIIIIWAYRTSRKNTSPQAKEDGALEILKKRFAKGEITKDEYEEMKKTLGHY